MSLPFVASRGYVVLAVVALCLLVPLTGVVAAQSPGDVAGTVVIEEDETVDSVDTLAGTIVVRGTVSGDLSGAAGAIRIAETGEVGGDLEAAAGSILVAGAVDGNVRTGAGSFEVTDSGRIGGDLEVGAGYVRVDGSIGGNVRAAAGSISIGPNANVGGEFRYDAEEFDQSPDAVIEGGVVEDSDLRVDSGIDLDEPIVPAWFGTVYSALASLLLGTILLAAFPRFSGHIARRVIETPIRSGGVGLGVLIGVPIVLLLVAITIVGIPLALFGAGLFVLAIWTGVVYGQYAVGTWVLELLGTRNRWLALVVGIVGIALVGTIPIVGGLVDLLVLLVGLGALAGGVTARYRTGAEKTAGPNGSGGT